MSESDETVVRSFFASWTGGDAAVIAAFIADDAVWIDGPRGRYEGRAAIAAELDRQVAGASNVVVELTAIASSGRTVLNERVDRFNRAGLLFALGVAGVLDFDDKGQIIQWRDYYDLKELTDQLVAAGLA